MSLNSRRLAPLKTLARSKERAALRKMASSEQRASVEHLRLSELSNYLEQYRDQIAEGQCTNARVLRMHSQFVARLCTAVDTQQQRAQQADQDLDTTTQNWRSERRECGVYDLLEEKFERRESDTQRKREQTELDEAAAKTGSRWSQ